MKLKLKDVTLCAVTSIKIDETIKALKYSMKDIEFGEVKIISNEKINENNIKWEECPKLDYKGYSTFLVNELYRHIHTKHTLIINYDGFVINPTMWRDEFLEYDYIGALWPHNEEMGWIGQYRVGNGGFSLRTKCILEAASKYDFPKRFDDYSEDGYFCNSNRSLYVDKGFRYAPLDVAKHFSHESYCPEIVGIIPFGFHGKQHYDLISLLNTI